MFTRLHNEPSLLRDLANDDQSAFRLIFDHYKPILFRSAFGLIGDQSMAEDLLQETFVKVWIHRKTLNQVQNFGGWLYTIYENLMFNTIKRLARANKHHQDWQNTLPAYNLPDYQVEIKEIENTIEQAISRLPEKQRATFKLIKQQGLTRTQAAAQLGVAPETVKTNLDYAVKSIRAYCLKTLDKHPLAPYIIIFLKLFF